MSVARYPLAWPKGWPRSGSPGGRRLAQFKVDFEKAVRELGWEIERMGGRYPVLSTNLELTIDGRPRRDRGEPADRGVAVYFELKGKQKVFACETFTSVRDNIRAIGLTIAALRAIERFGASDMLERALSAFEALPAPLEWWDVLQIRRDAGRETIEAAFRRLAKDHHPDRGGSTAKMAELNRAREAALKETGA